MHECFLMSEEAAAVAAVALPRMGFVLSEPYQSRRIQGCRPKGKIAVSSGFNARAREVSTRLRERCNAIDGLPPGCRNTAHELAGTASSDQFQ